MVFTFRDLTLCHLEPAIVVRFVGCTGYTSHSSTFNFFSPTSATLAHFASLLSLMVLINLYLQHLQVQWHGRLAVELLHLRPPPRFFIGKQVSSF